MQGFRTLCSVGAVLLSINCENGNGLAIEAHPLIITLFDLIPRCRPRGLART